jgi:hypothetical protein
VFDSIRKMGSAFFRGRARRRALKALALNRNEARTDGLSLTHLRNRLEIEWRARDIHPWDRGVSSSRAAQLFAEQCLRDVNAAVERLFDSFAEVDVIELKVFDPSSGAPILLGTVIRAETHKAKSPSPGMKLKQLGVNYRLNNWRFEPLG